MTTHGSELSLNDAESLNDGYSSFDDEENASMTSGTGSPTAHDRVAVSDGEQQTRRVDALPFTISVDGESLVAVSHPATSSSSLPMLQSSSATSDRVLSSGSASASNSNNEGESELTADQTIPVPAAALAFLEGSLTGAALCGPRKWSHRMWVAVASANPAVGGLLLQYERRNSHLRPFRLIPA